MTEDTITEQPKTEQEQLLELLEAYKGVLIDTRESDSQLGKITREIELVKRGIFTGAQTKRFARELKQKAEAYDKALKAKAREARDEALAKLRLVKEIAANKKRELSEEQQQKRAEDRLKASDTIQEIIESHNFYQTKSGTLSWMYQELPENEYGQRAWRSIKKDALQANFCATNVFIRSPAPGEPDYRSLDDFTKTLAESGRTFTHVVLSFTKETGDECLNILHKEFCPPSEDGSTDYHWLLDAIIESISGGPPGDANTFESFQRTIWSKYINPTNVYLPSLFLNDDGSTGKSMFVTQFCTRLFNGSVANNCNISHLTGNFNGTIAGKAIIFINEAARDKVDVEKVKSFIGSPTFQMNEKYEKTVEVDNIGLVISAANGKDGGITLSGLPSDRRYSIFSSKLNIYDVVTRYLKEKEGIELKTLSEAKGWVETNANGILHSKEQVGKWVSAMYEKHGEVRTVEPNHAEAYVNLVERQRGGWLKTVETIFTDDNFVYIREELLEQLIKHCNPLERLPGRHKIREEIDRLIKDRKLDITREAWFPIETLDGDIMRRCVWVVKGEEIVREDESAYVEQDLNQRDVWVFKG